MLTAAFILGFTGSLHCIGMCGPLAVQVQAPNNKKLVLNRALYNTGRVVTYSLLGLMAGLFGHLIELSGWQGWLSIMLGLAVLGVLLFKQVERWVLPKTFMAINFLKQGISKFIRQRSAGSAVLMGVLNGFLPCGLVYAAVVLSLVQTNWINSVMVMLAFGLGTVPAMLVTAWLYTNIIGVIPIPVKKIQLVFVGLMAFIMIWRGVSIEGLFAIDKTVLCYPLH
ncbi:MAG: sulfite exporter TauE/SafE family protein [Flammeovirgaceae bacterium]|nr:MAG: sulfite exporter TauE/SafE family protein [Flammeovirgaceae bacterium]